MTDHLPECHTHQKNGGWCICPALRACEQRIKETTIPRHRDEWIADGYHNGYEVGYEAGRDAALTLARDAVAALPFVRPAYYGKGVLIHGTEPDFVRTDALAAIDAVRRAS